MKLVSGNKTGKVLMAVFSTVAAVGTTYAVVKKECSKKTVIHEHITWTCPACGKRQTLESLKGLSEKECNACHSKVKLDIDNVRTTLKSKCEHTHTCGHCKYYRNNLNNQYHVQGGGTCHFDKQLAKIMKMPHSLCHCGKFERS